MRRRSQLCPTLLAAALPLALGACFHGSASGGAVAPGQQRAMPSWVERSSALYHGGDGRAFHGVGIVQGIDSESLARQTADNRARGEIAKIFDVYIAALMRDYQRATSTGAASSEEQDVLAVQKTITEVTLPGIEIRDHWRDPASGALYALAVLDLDRVAEQAARARSLDQSAIEHVRSNARRAFEDLERELGGRSSARTPPPEPVPSQPRPPAPPPSLAESTPSPSDPPAAAPPATPPPGPAVQPARQHRVGLKVSGRDAKTIQTCFASSLLDKRYQLYERSSDVDFLVRARLSYRRLGKVEGARMIAAKLDTRLIRLEDGATIAAINKKIKVGRPTYQQALLTASSKLCRLVTPEIVDELAKAL